MIDFACRQFSLDEVIKCGLGLSKAEYSLLSYLLDHDEEWFTSHTLSSNLNLNLTTIQRAVKKLYDKSILTRSQTNLKSGGYLFVYQIKSREAVRKIILDIVRKWVAKVEMELSKW